VTTVFAGLRDRGTQLIWVGAILAVLMYVIGPGRAPVWVRTRAARAVRITGRGLGRGGRGVATHGPGWIARHLDAVRVGGIVVAALFALILSSWTSLLVIIVVAAAFEVLVTVVARRADPAQPTPPSPPPTPPSTPQPAAAG
jgi:hypothetical protein